MPDVFNSKEKMEIKHNKVPYKNRPTHKFNPLWSFILHPKDIMFETLENDEQVIMFLRKHWITNAGWILMGILMILTPFFVSKLSLFEGIPSNFMFVFALIWYLVTTAYLLESFLTWFFNIYIITDERIIDIDFYNLIYKEVSDANIDKIQDVTYKMGGFIRTIFDYGDVLIQTASEVPNFEFEGVSKPSNVVKVLQDLRTEEQQEAIEGRVR